MGFAIIIKLTTQFGILFLIARVTANTLYSLNSSLFCKTLPTTVSFYNILEIIPY